MLIRRYRLAATIMLGIHLAACVQPAWQAVALSPRQFVEEEEPELIRVTQSDGRRRTLSTPVVRGDSIVSAAPDRTAIAITDIRSLEVGNPDGGRTVEKVAIIGTVVTIVAIVLFQTKDAFSEWDGPLGTRRR